MWGRRRGRAPSARPPGLLEIVEATVRAAVSAATGAGADPQESAAAVARAVVQAVSVAELAPVSLPKGLDVEYAEQQGLEKVSFEEGVGVSDGGRKGEADQGVVAESDGDACGYEAECVERCSAELGSAGMAVERYCEKCSSKSTAICNANSEMCAVGEPGEQGMAQAEGEQGAGGSAKGLARLQDLQSNPRADWYIGEVHVQRGTQTEGSLEVQDDVVVPYQSLEAMGLEAEAVSTVQCKAANGEESLVGYGASLALGAEPARAEVADGVAEGRRGADSGGDSGDAVKEQEDTESEADGGTVGIGDAAQADKAEARSVVGGGRRAAGAVPRRARWADGLDGNTSLAKVGAEDDTKVANARLLEDAVGSERQTAKQKKKRVKVILTSTPIQGADPQEVTQASGKQMASEGAERKEEAAGAAGLALGGPPATASAPSDAPAALPRGSGPSREQLVAKIFAGCRVDAADEASIAAKSDDELRAVVAAIERMVAGAAGAPGRRR